MRTMAWPPVPLGGRLGWVEGADASAVLVLMTLSDLQTNPFNDKNLSLGDITFRVRSANKARIDNALRRLARIIAIESIIESVDPEGNVRYNIKFQDRETRVAGEVLVG